MINEYNIEQEKTKLFNIQSAQIKKNFEKRRINSYPCEHPSKVFNIISKLY